MRLWQSCGWMMIDTMKRKSPIKAVFLNVLIPGLGCAYLGKWIYALLFFIWTPLAFFAATLVGSLIAGFFPENFQWLWTVFLVFAVRIRILYDLVFTPYRLAEEYNANLDPALISEPYMQSL